MSRGTEGPGDAAAPSSPLGGVISTVLERAGRLGRRVLNGVRFATGMDPPVVGSTPRVLIWSGEWARLWRYESADRRYEPPLLIVHSLVSRSRILDLRRGHSFVGHLLAAGFDVFLLEWEPPDERAARRTLTDYVDDDIPMAIAKVRRTSGAADVTLMGYCFGGIFTLITAARDTDGSIRNLVTMVAAVDFTEVGTVANILGPHGIESRALLDADGNLPASTVARGIRLLRPTAELRALATMWQSLDDDDRVEALRSVHDWLAEQVAFPGELFVECVEAFVHRNALMTGSLVVAGEPVDLGAVECPYLSVVADHDFVVPVAAALPAVDLVGSDDATLLRLPAGHVAFVASARQLRELGPQIVGWLETRSAAS